MNWRARLRWLLAMFFVAAGANHFRDPHFYLRAMPSWLPWQQQLIAISGHAEVLGGIGLLVPGTRPAAGWGLVALLVAVFPVNVEMALRGGRPLGPHDGNWLLWVRLPLQAGLIAMTCWVASPDARERRPSL